jgi:hypothetical protein
MHPRNDAKDTDFSPCSQSSICDQLRNRNLGACLVDPIPRIVEIREAMCGNGVKEGDEQCDCGSDAECANDPCCDVGCQLRVGRQCR